MDLHLASKMIRMGGWAILTMALVIGCSDSDSGGSGGQPLDASGRWALNATGIFPMTLNLAHNGTTLRGTVTDAERYAVRVTGTTASPQGDASGARNVTLTITFNDGQVATLTGTVAGDNATMAGRYTTNWGGSDSWRATRL